jgi:hypothetical protein
MPWNIQVGSVESDIFFRLTRRTILVMQTLCKRLVSKFVRMSDIEDSLTIHPEQT